MSDDQKRDGAYLSTHQLDSQYQRIASRFWDDGRVRTWSDNAKLLSLYLQTCRHRSLEGIFKMPLTYIGEDLGWTLRRIRKGMDELIAAEHISYDSASKVLLLRKSLRYQSPTNPNVGKAAIRRLLGLPETPLLQDFLSVALEYLPHKREQEKEYLWLQELVQVFGQMFKDQLPLLNSLLNSLLSININSSSSRTLAASADERGSEGVPPVLGGEKDKQDMQPVSESLKHFRKLAEKHTR